MKESLNHHHDRKHIIQDLEGYYIMELARVANLKPMIEEIQTKQQLGHQTSKEQQLEHQTSKEQQLGHQTSKEQQLGH